MICRSSVAALAFLTLAIPALVHAAPPSGGMPLLTFDSSFDKTTIHGNGARGELADGVLRIVTPAGNGWPGVMVKVPSSVQVKPLFRWLTVTVVLPPS